MLQRGLKFGVVNWCQTFEANCISPIHSNKIQEAQRQAHSTISVMGMVTPTLTINDLDNKLVTDYPEVLTISRSQGNIVVTDHDYLM